MTLARSPWTTLGMVACMLAGTACSSVSHYGSGGSSQEGAPPTRACARMITAEVVALEQAVVLNRFGAFNPSGMLFALKHDVVLSDGTALNEDNIKRAAGNVRLRDDKRPRPLVLRVNEQDCLEVRFHNLLMPAVPDERTRGPEQYGGKIPAHMEDPDGVVYPDKGRTGRELVKATAISSDIPHTRVASFHVNGLDYVSIKREDCPVTTQEQHWICGTDGDNVGLNRGLVNTGGALALSELQDRLEQHGTLIEPGEHAIYRYRARREGTYFAYSTGATVGGEGDGGQLGMGLFGAVNVQPEGSRWYRSQVNHGDLQEATVLQDPQPGRHPYRVIDYAKRYASGPRKNRPILAMLDGDEIVHSDLNAVVVLDNHLQPDGSHDDGHDTTSPTKHCTDYMFGNSCGLSYREFTVIMHDEVKAVQAFQELEDPGNPLHYVKDGMGINYGVAGMGAMVMARQRRVAPLRDCPECRAEEFFLSSWANGDPALLLKWDKVNPNKPVGALYPDDPSNVHHSYLGDPVRFRNIHAGPKETHVFHLHAHQWVMDPSDPGSTYLDSQTISPGATFSYEVEFGGSGNKNRSAGDSIFHCHLYPHFAQGMWELWRVHDVFEDGTPGLGAASGVSLGRNYPDAEVAGGTESPALVPLPGTALPPMPTTDFKGYPFYIAGKSGHRPPQPPLDMDFDGGLPRHVLLNGGNSTKPAGAAGHVLNQDVVDEALSKGGEVAKLNAAKVYALNPNSLLALAEQWEGIGWVEWYKNQATVDGQRLTSDEQTAMAFHAGELTKPGFRKTVTTDPPHPGADEWEQEHKGYITDWATDKSRDIPRSGEAVFYVNGRGPKHGAPFADPCPARAPSRQYKAGVIQTEITVNRHGWFDPQARILALEQDIQDIIDPNTRTHLPDPLFFRANSGDCITFMHSNFLPNAMGLDDFQVYTPTDTVGQHIHLVKFDVMASDGSGNGWNYEDGTFSPEEVRERIVAYNRALKQAGKPADEFLTFKTHPLFQAACPAGDETADKKRCTALQKKGQCPDWTMSKAEMEQRTPKLTATEAEQKTFKADLKDINEHHPYCAAQRTVQRWYADPILDPKTHRDHTLRTVFTHDHFGPSTHQQHGLYAALVIEPANSVWLPIDKNHLTAEEVKDSKKVIGGADVFSPPTTSDPATELRQALKVGGRDDGGPTSTRANIVAPKCLGKKHSNPLNPNWHKEQVGEDCAEDSQQTHDTKREFAIAFADFAILYNTALEPINPEERDASALRFGRRQVPINLPTPLAISSEDPGTQLINYRNEPLPLRITDRTASPELGGFDYRQTPCALGDLRCTGDMANVFSSRAHEIRDKNLLSVPYGAIVSPSTRGLLKNVGLEGKLDDALVAVEQWRKAFTCALYPQGQQPQEGCTGTAITNNEPWRQMGDPATPILPAYEGDPVQIRLIQGAQEAQHVFSMNGVKWLREPAVKQSGYVSAQPLGISEHFEFDIKTMAPDASKTDYLYFGSSMDQLWDGMWGLLRAYGTPRTEDEKKEVVPHLARLPEVPEPLVTHRGGKANQVCQVDGLTPLKIGISALRICQLTGDCDNAAGRAQGGGIPYNQRLGMTDPNGIIFVRNNRVPGGGEQDFLNKQMSPADVLKQLRLEFASGLRRIEPLVLRAPAGSCLEVQVMNHLPEALPDGPGLLASDTSDNFMSMTLDGFNYNQFRMSSTVGLSAPLVAQYAHTSDGSHVGLNEIPGAEVGGLVPACRSNGSNRFQCQPRSVFWYAGDFQLVQKPETQPGTGQQMAVPIEFGAIPLRSFGDVIKHPAHGAIGALVIGPKGSHVCQSDDPREQQADAGTDLSATICGADGKKLYRDFVMVLQDAVDAKQAGWPVPNLKGAEEPDDYGVKAVNYRTEPLWGRRGGDPSVEFEERNEVDFAHALSSKPSDAGCQAGIPVLPELEKLGRAACDPETPIFVARAGNEIRMRIVHPGGHTRQQAITVHGHHWSPFPWKEGSTEMYADSESALKNSWIIQGSYNSVGPMMAANLLTKAGGDDSIPGDYLFRSQASFVFDGGIWGLLRVIDSTPIHEP